MPILTTKEFADKFGTSEKTVKQAKQFIREGSDELKESVIARKIDLSKSAEISKLPIEEQIEVISKPLPKKESTRKSDFDKTQIAELKTFYETLSEITGLSDFDDIISYVKNLKEESCE